MLRARLGTSPLPFPTPALMEAEAAQLATCETKTRLVTRLDAFRGLPGTRLSLKSQVPLQVVGFDPLNLHVLPDGSYLHARYLRLSGPAVELEVLGGQALAHGPGPLTVTDLEVAGLPADLTPTLEAGRWCLKGEVLSVQVSQSCVTRDGAGGWHLHF
ncbi:hypothetical protein V3W47_16295 [Deinococcus sp. YIM 134068]|uniref:hypothetical protein n=1 Tax=Deinococcus lichenicola TaxID=3118910 RepID=UPI002F95D08D